MGVTPEAGASGNTEEEERTELSQAAEAAPPSEQTIEATEPSVTSQPVTQSGGRRTQLRILREGIESISRDMGSFRNSHGASVNRLEKQVASLRKEFAAHTRAKDLGNLAKNHQASSKRLEKQVATLRSDLAALRSSIAKDAARSRAKQEAALSRILAKVSARPKAAKGSATKKKKKR